MSSSKLVLSAAAGVGGVNIVEYIGSDVVGASNGNSMDLYTNDIGTLETGDLMIVQFSAAAGSDLRSGMSLATSGFTELASNNAVDSNQVSTKIYYKNFAGETFIRSNSISGASSASVSLSASVFRNHQNINVFSNTALTNTDDASWSTVTGLSNGNVVALFASTAHTVGFRYYSDPGDLDSWAEGANTIFGNDSYDITSGTGAKTITSGTSFSPNTWNTNGSGTASSVVAVSIVVS